MANDDVLQMFLDSGALLKGHFLYTSGRHGAEYYEKFCLLRQPPYVEKMCTMIADKFKCDNVQLVVGPTTGGIIIAYETAKKLGIDSIYAEPGESGRVFKRGFSIDPGTRVLIVDDVMTTGRSVNEVVALCESYDANIVGIAVLLDRSGGETAMKYPLHALATVHAVSWAPEDCPLCQDNVPITQRGSRKMKTE